jgi:hypothetical protein
LEIMAITGHKTLKEVERYTKAADQERMAERAIARTPSYPTRGSVLPTGEKGVTYQDPKTIRNLSVEPPCFGDYQ